MTKTSGGSRAQDPTGVVYRPHVLARPGELAALARLSDKAQARVFPVVVIPPLPPALGSRPGELLEHLRRLPELIFRARGTRGCHIDVSMLGEGPFLPNGQHALAWLSSARVRSQGLFVPLISDSSSASTLTAAGRAARHGGGLGLRLGRRTWGAGTLARARRLLGTLGVGPEEVDLFLDVSTDEIDLIDRAASFIAGEGSSVPWRSISVGGRILTRHVSHAERISTVPRWNLLAFQRAQAASRAPGRRPPALFDYMASELGEDARGCCPGPAFTYSTEDSCVVFRGGADLWQVRDRDSRRALTPMMRQVAAHHAFSRPIATDTDWWIANAAQGGHTRGPLEWSERAAHRHLQITLHQLGCPA